LPINIHYQLLALDIDGTIVDKNGNISAQDLQTLSEVKKTGLKISLCTGRSANSCVSIIDQLQLEGYHTFCDGALVCNRDQSQEIYAEPIQPEQVKRLCATTQAYNIALELYTAQECLVDHETANSALERDFFGFNPRVTPFTDIWQKERIIKGGVATTSPAEEARVKALSREFAGSLEFGWARTPAYPSMCFINVTAPGVCKGQALKALAKHLDIDLANVMAIGDGRNDLSLLSEAGLAVAMGNAPQDLLALADYITEDVDHHGVTRALRQFLL
jgi:5-amino-6-(5-phospho-D-ribitylamino)uracil phosphatase